MRPSGRPRARCCSWTSWGSRRCPSASRATGGGRGGHRRPRRDLRPSARRGLRRGRQPPEVRRRRPAGVVHGEHHAARAAWSAHNMRDAPQHRPSRDHGREGRPADVLGVHSGSFHFFLVGDSHRELIVTGPAASRTVEMEGTATAGRSSSATTRRRPPPEGARAAQGRWGPAPERTTGLSIDKDQKEVLPPRGWTSPPASRWRSESICAKGDRPRAPNATIAFVHFDGVDGMLAESGADVVAAGLHELVEVVQRHAEHNGVTFLGTDIDHDGARSSSSAAPRTRSATTRAGCCSRSGRSSTPMRACRCGSGESRARLRGRRRARLPPDVHGDRGREPRRARDVDGGAGADPSTGLVLDGSSIAFNAVALEPFMVKGKKDPVHASMVGYLTGSKPEDVARDSPARRDGEMGAFRQALLDLRRSRLAGRDRRQRRDGQDPAAQRVPLGGA